MIWVVILGLYRGLWVYIYICRGNIGIMEKKLETGFSLTAFPCLQTFPAELRRGSTRLCNEVLGKLNCLPHIVFHCLGWDALVAEYG